MKFALISFLTIIPQLLVQSLGANVAFWHIYAGIEDFATVALNQMSTMASTGLLDKLDKVYYVVGGKFSQNFSFSMDSNQWVEQKFQRMLHPNASFYEVHTLSKLYEHCKFNANDRVLYFHNKGSYHNGTINMRWRKTLDCFVLNPHCLTALEGNNYDICGFRLSPFPHVHYSGNYWCVDILSLSRPGNVYLLSQVGYLQIRQ